MTEITLLAGAFLAITVMVVVGKNKLPKWARFGLMATQAILLLFTIAVITLG